MTLLGRSWQTFVVSTAGIVIMLIRKRRQMSLSTSQKETSGFPHKHGEG